MKTSKEMQLKILDKMRENVENDFSIVKYVQYDSRGTWYDKESVSFDFGNYSYRVKPEKITINGVEVSKPTAKSEWSHVMFEPSSRIGLRRDVHQDSFHLYDDGALLYADIEEAIEASKALFGIEG